MSVANPLLCGCMLFLGLCPRLSAGVTIPDMISDAFLSVQEPTTFTTEFADGVLETAGPLDVKATAISGASEYWIRVDSEMKVNGSSDFDPLDGDVMDEVLVEIVMRMSTGRENVGTPDPVQIADLMYSGNGTTLFDVTLDRAYEYRFAGSFNPFPQVPDTVPIERKASFNGTEFEYLGTEATGGFEDTGTIGPGTYAFTATLAWDPPNEIRNEGTAATTRATLTLTLPANPEIAVEEPVGSDLVSGADEADFGSGLVGSTSDAKTFTVRNTGTADLTSLSVSVIGANAADYTVDASGLGSTIAPGGSATFTATFSPSAEGTRVASLQIASNDADENPFVIDLTGEGVTPMMIAQLAYLKASNAGITDYFGTSVALSGNTAVVGAWGERGDAGSTVASPNNNAPAAGAAYVFVRNGTSWSQQGYLKAANADANDEFGRSVAIDGDTLIVGANDESGDFNSTATTPNDNAPDAGAAYVFVRSGTTWSQQAYLKASNTGEGDEFGISVSIDGDTVVVGAHEEQGDATSTAASPNDNAGIVGAAYVFVRNGTNWSQQAYLKASNAGAGWRFGWSVSVDGNTIIVGAHNGSGGAIQSGAAYIFERTGTSWSEQTYLQASNPSNFDFFGSSVAIEGDTVVVGAHGEDGDENSTVASPNDSANNAGAVYVFVRSGTVWNQQAYLKASNAGADDYFGGSVSLDGSTLVVGARDEAGDSNSTALSPNNNASSTGAVYMYVRNGAIWNQNGYVKASNAEMGDEFGASVALLGDILIVGSVEEDGDASSSSALPNENMHESGAAYLFDLGLQPDIPEIAVEEPPGSDLVSGTDEVDFGSGLVGSTSDAKNFTVRNSGAGDLTGLVVSVSGAAASDYSVDDTLLGTTIAAGGSATFSVTFSPSAEYTRAASLQIVSNDADENPFDIDLTGEGITPVTIAQEAYLKASNAGGGDRFGYSVDISGNTVVVGAFTEAGDSNSTAASPNDNAILAGAAYVFVRTGTSWSQQAYLKASNAESDEFGWSVSVSGDTLVVGARNEDGDAGSTALIPNDNADSAGAAYVFVRNGANWSQQAYLKASNAGEGDFFGNSVSISGDTLVVGANSEDGNSSSTAVSPNDNANQAGAAYVFVRIGSSWSQQAYLKASNAGGGDQFGYSAAIDGDTVIMGAVVEDGDAASAMGSPNNNASAAGAAYVFVRSGITWTQEAYLKASNASGSDQFGYSVAIDGDTAVVGAAFEAGDANSTATSSNDNAYGAGAAYVFLRSGANWTQQAYLKASNAEGSDEFGISVGVSGDTVVVGADMESGDASSSAASPNDNAANSGAAYVFLRIGSSWSQLAYLKASNTGASDVLGGSVGIFEDRIVVGAVGEDGDTNSTVTSPNNNAGIAGAAYIFNFITAAEEAFAMATSDAGLIGSDALPLATPFNDGVPNLLKYAFNMNLTGPDSSTMEPGGASGLPTFDLDNTGPQTVWRVEFVRRKGSGLIYTPMKSTTLTTFEPMSGSATVTDIDGQWERVIVEEPCDPATTPKCFSHVRVEVP